MIRKPPARKGTGTLEALQKLVGRRGAPSRGQRRPVPRSGITHPSDVSRSFGPTHPSDASRRANFQRELGMSRLRAPRRSAPRPPIY